MKRLVLLHHLTTKQTAHYHVKAETHLEEVLSLLWVLQESLNEPDKVCFKSFISWINLSSKKYTPKIL